MRIDQLLLIGFLVGSSFVYGGAMTLVMTAMVIFYLVDPYSIQNKVMFPGVGFFAVIMLVGLMGYAGKAPYDIAKDVWYVSNAVFPILIGYLMIQRMDDLRQVLRTFIAASTIVAVVHILQFVRNPSYLAESFVDIRSRVSPGYFMTVLGIAIIIGDFKFGLSLLKKRFAAWGCVTLCMLSVVLSFSRTLWLALLTAVGVVVIAGNVKRVVQISIAAACIALVASWAGGPAATGDISEHGTSFMGKIVNSIQELKVSEYADMTDINQYWRGFESYRALETYASGSVIEYLRGKGFGTDVDLGFVMTLAEVEFERIPVLHNGYLYLLVKTGAVGLAAYLLFLLLVFRTGIQLSRLSDAETRVCGLILVALTLIVLETTLVISGLFSKAALYQIALLMGMLLRYAEIRLLNKSDANLAFALSVRQDT